MKRKNNLLLTSLILALIIITTIILRSPLDSQSIPTTFIAAETNGFNLDPGQLNFGKITPGSSATRKITITNNFNLPTITKIKSSGEISNYIIVSENNFILEPNESRDIAFSCLPELGIELKEYTGKITIITNKA